MCPLRIILIFLSATLAGFFVLRNLKSQPGDADADADAAKENNSSTIASDSLPLSSKLCGAIAKGFWTCVDMASGRYLWRNLIAADSSSASKRAD
ncbi:hypothetical protein M9H77_01025 [Catharanthus roseus]|uniref:Uncharacterized protein n=1 Tax=Catharanthus roseus TaxID=4058 RepID=A0ACC0C4V6_CATRO|nr:hypothetical protein M9H77_01025 [Catharanthus roseus]